MGFRMALSWKVLALLTQRGQQRRQVEGSLALQVQQQFQSNEVYSGADGVRYTRKRLMAWEVTRCDSKSSCPYIIMLRDHWTRHRLWFSTVTMNDLRD